MKSLTNYKYDSDGNLISKPALQIFDYAKFYEGMIYKTSHGDVIIIKYYDSLHVEIEFLDNTHYRTITTLHLVLDGTVKNPYKPLIHGGYIGEGIYLSSDKAYGKWAKIMERANAHIRGFSSYNECFVSDEWLNYQNFARWYYNYLSLLNPLYEKQYAIDKDILQWNMRNKIYSSSTCCLIPSRINTLIINLQDSNKSLPIGVYKEPNNLYRSSVGYNDKTYHSKYCDTPEEAFEIYKNKKMQIIQEVSTFYYKEKAITSDIYERLCNLEILPYPNSI